MKRNKDYEKALYYSIESADPKADCTVNELLEFWKHYDKLFQTNHYRILQALASPISEHYTAEGLALLFHVSDRTLLRYRNLYIESYVALCEENGVNPFCPAER